jgi:hypothetical protein
MEPIIEDEDNALMSVSPGWNEMIPAQEIPYV